MSEDINDTSLDVTADDSVDDSTPYDPRLHSTKDTVDSASYTDLLKRNRSLEKKLGIQKGNVTIKLDRIKDLETQLNDKTNEHETFKTNLETERNETKLNNAIVKAFNDKGVGADPDAIKPYLDKDKLDMDNIVLDEAIDAMIKARPNYLLSKTATRSNTPVGNVDTNTSIRSDSDINDEISKMSVNEKAKLVNDLVKEFI